MRGWRPSMARGCGRFGVVAWKQPTLDPTLRCCIMIWAAPRFFARALEGALESSRGAGSGLRLRSKAPALPMRSIRTGTKPREAERRVAAPFARFPFAWFRFAWFRFVCFSFRSGRS